MKASGRLPRDGVSPCLLPGVPSPQFSPQASLSLSLGDLCRLHLLREEWWVGGAAWGWLTGASVKTVMGFLEPPPWAHTTSHPYMLTSPTDAAIPPPATLERVDQEIMSVQTMVGPEAPGPAGDQASPGPRGPLTLQEASPQPPGTEVVEESGEAQ